MRRVKTISTSILIALVLVLYSGIAHAIPGAEFRYAETDLGGGLWQYDYTLYNTSDPILDAGVDLYDLFISFNPSATLTVVSLPTGWELIDGLGFAETFSTMPGPHPGGTDIAPDSSLSGFSFIFDYQAGGIPFDATLVNPADLSNPFVYSSTSSQETPVPEPATLLLVSAGLIGMGLYRKRFRA